MMSKSAYNTLLSPEATVGANYLLPGLYLQAVFPFPLTRIHTSEGAWQRSAKTN
jgi:hypothetical protein